MRLSEKIKLLRKKRNLSQKKLAEKLCLQRNQIILYEKNRAKPSIDTLQNIALIFGVTIDFLLDDKENQTLDTFGFNDKELFVYCQSIDKMSEKTRESLKYILKKIILCGDAHKETNKIITKEM